MVVKDVYCWYISARTLGQVGKEQLMRASQDTTDPNRALLAKTVLAVALNGGGGTFEKNLPLSLDYAQEVGELQLILIMQLHWLMIRCAVGLALATKSQCSSHR